MATTELEVLKRSFVTPQGVFYLEEAYGINTNRRDDEDSKECLICMTDRKDTLAKPCKHVCLCQSCA